MNDKKLDKAAIALKYSQDKNKAPEIVAAGKGPQADAIIAMAQSRGIPVHDRAMTAANGLTAIDMQTEIPPQFYQLVAEILWFVHQLDDTWPERKKTKLKEAPRYVK